MPDRLPRSVSRRPRVALAAALAAVLASTVALSVCGGCSGKDDAGPTYPERKANLPDLSKGGTVRGVVRFEGEAPKRGRIDMPDAWCQSHNDPPAELEKVVVENGMLRDVLVHVRDGLGAWTFDYEKAEAAMDQRNCQYVPHVLAVRAYQPVAFRSSDGTPHNVNCSASAQGFNKTFNGPSTYVHQFPKSELKILSKCNIHPWMEAWIHVVDHPYFAVTRADGAYALPQKLPPGDYVLEALHPELGTQTAKVTVAPDGELTQDFVFKKR